VVDPVTSAGDWFEGLPDDLKVDDTVATYKGKPVADVATALKDLSGKLAATAAPATPNDYGIALPASLAELAKDPEVAKDLNAELANILAEAHADGMSKTQAQARVEREAKALLAQLDASKKAAAAAEKALKEKWGDKYDERKVLTARAIETLPEGVKKIVTDGKLASDPFFVELIHTIGEAQREGRLHEGDPGASTKPISERLYGGTP
jgi:Skp family chaperone for outer membrane proteins